jgi:hypothetical protein
MPQDLAMQRLALVLALASCKTSPPAPAFHDGAGGLKALFTASQTACATKDYARGKAIVSSLIPTRDDLKAALADGAPAGFVDKVIDQFKEFPAEEERAACVFSPPGRTEILVHASTTEDIAAYKDNSIAYEEFPGGAKKLAETVLRRHAMFYEVEAVEPGHDRGTKFHLFFWDGAQWRMLGPAWRVL